MAVEETSIGVKAKIIKPSSREHGEKIEKREVRSEGV